MNSVGPPVFDVGGTAPEVPQAPQGKGPNAAGVLVLVLIAVALLLLAFRTDTEDEPEVLTPLPTTTTLPPLRSVAPNPTFFEDTVESPFPATGYMLSGVQTVIASPTAIRDGFGGFVAGEQLGDMAFITSESGIRWTRENASTVRGIPTGYQSDALFALANGRLIGSFVDLSRSEMIISSSDDGVEWSPGIELSSTNELSMRDVVFADGRLFITLLEREDGVALDRMQIHADWNLREAEPLPIEEDTYLRALTETFNGLLAIQTSDPVLGAGEQTHQLITRQDGQWGSFGENGLPVEEVLDLHVARGQLYAVTPTVVYRSEWGGGPWEVVSLVKPPDSTKEIIDYEFGPQGGVVVFRDPLRAIEEGQYSVLTSFDLLNWTENPLAEQFTTLQLKTFGTSVLLEGRASGMGPQQVQVPLR